MYTNTQYQMLFSNFELSCPRQHNSTGAMASGQKLFKRYTQHRLIKFISSPEMILFSSALALLPLSLAAPALAAPALAAPALDPKGLSRVNLVLDNQ